MYDSMRYHVAMVSEHHIPYYETQGYYLPSDEEVRFAGVEVNDMWTLVGRRAFANAPTRPSLNTPAEVDAAEFWALAMEDMEGYPGSFIQYVMLKRKEGNGAPLYAQPSLYPDDWL